MAPFVNVENISYTYHTLSGETKAIDNLSFGINKGEFISIVGPSGCGKSTLLSIIAGLLTPSSGEVYINNNKIIKTSNDVGYMLQKDHLFEWRTVIKNITLGLEIQKKFNTEENLDYIDSLLKLYGLYDFKNYHPSQLSGGMRQRVALIRTLALKPDLLLLDEPFSALDYQTRLSVADDIGNIIKKEKKTAILVTHDIAEAISMADRVIVLSKRPATIKTIVPIELSIDDRTPFKSRSAKEFGDYFNLIWKELDIDVNEE
ncbi:NitT/TauT family transport system ATP-binding protein [Natranaerovirga pectinivora]|uniref:NitT/TauT family transport system ATP-binding protein n=1 Tax=Natranaerovirga pectinivora TaxID=682400 RepID=A0A4R3ML76_9FIRM|nr:ABC transporter ATP-binding protein [Natranaerovirga pectinivora]TCT14618.1 NitT/TauT family transport system ATP-binding protein [Natranaerovirga pectinivora]